MLDEQRPRLVLSSLWHHARFFCLLTFHGSKGPFSGDADRPVGRRRAIRLARGQMLRGTGRRDSLCSLFARLKRRITMPETRYDQSAPQQCRGRVHGIRAGTS
jgi:hypothetical protein